MAFPSPKRMGFKNVPPDPQPTGIGKSGPWAFLLLVGRIMGRMQYAPTLSAGRGISPLAFSSLAGWIRGRMQYAPTHPAGRKSDPWAFLSLAGRAGGGCFCAPIHSEGRKCDPWAFSPLVGRARGGGFCAPTHSAEGKSDPWAFSSLAGRIRGRMQYVPTHSTGRKIVPSAFPSPKRMGFKNVPPNPQPTRIGKSDPWAFPPLAGRTRGRIQYAPTHSEGRKIAPSAFPSPKRMGFKNVLLNPQPTRIGKSVPWPLPSLAGRIRGRIQYVPTLLEGRKNHPWAFLSLAGRAGRRMQYAPTYSTGRKIAPSAFSSPKRMGFKNVPPNPQPTRIGKSDPWAFSLLARRARGGYFCDLSLLIFSDHYPQTYFSFLVFRTP